MPAVILKTKKVRDNSVLRDYATDAIRFWEPRRIGYNVVLPVIVILCFVSKLPASKQEVSVNLVLFIFELAVLANIAYCTAYPVDILVQITGYRDHWRTLPWGLFVVGVAFAGILTRFWALAVFSSGQ